MSVRKLKKNRARRMSQIRETEGTWYLYIEANEDIHVYTDKGTVLANIESGIPEGSPEVNGILMSRSNYFYDLLNRLSNEIEDVTTNYMKDDAYGTSEFLERTSKMRELSFVCQKEITEVQNLIKHFEKAQKKVVNE